MDYGIRMATVADAPALAKLLASLDFNRLHGLSIEQITAQLQDVLHSAVPHQRYTLYVAANEHEILGYCAVHWCSYLFMLGDEGFVSELFVADHARGMKIGTHLLDHVVAEATQRGAKRLSLINMRDRDSYLRGFYAKHGWQERPEAANFIYPLA